MNIMNRLHAVNSQKSFSDIRCSDELPVQNNMLVANGLTNHHQPTLLPYACQLDRERSIRSFSSDVRNSSSLFVNCQPVSETSNSGVASKSISNHVNIDDFDPFSTNNMIYETNTVTIGGNTSSERGMSAEMIELAEFCRTVSQPSKSACLRHIALPEGPHIPFLPDNQMFTERRGCPISRKISYWEEMMSKKSCLCLDSLNQPIVCIDITKELDIDHPKPVKTAGKRRICSVYKVPPPPTFSHRRKQGYVNPISQTYSTLSTNAKPLRKATRDILNNTENDLRSLSTVTLINLKENVIQTSSSYIASKPSLDSFVNKSISLEKDIPPSTLAKSVESEFDHTATNTAEHIENCDHQVMQLLTKPNSALINASLENKDNCYSAYKLLVIKL